MTEAKRHRFHMALFTAGAASAIAVASAGHGPATARAAAPAAPHAAAQGHTSLTPAQARAYLKEFGYVPRDPQNYLTLKNRAFDARYPNGGPTGGVAPGPLASIPSPSWQGVNDINVAPPDANGAIGPTRYVEIVNEQLGVYSRSGGGIGTIDLPSFAGQAAESTGNFSATDPVVLWDSATDRFYYQWLDLSSSTDYKTQWGFSKTSSPTASRSDWCQYTADFGYGSDLPDYPKFGQTADFLLIGVNMFPASGANDSDLDWIAKPQGTAPVTTCPAQSSFAKGVLKDGMTNQDGSLAFTPVPAIQDDPSSTGYVVATFDVATPVPLVPGADGTSVPVLATSNFISLYTITNNGGVPQMSAPRTLPIAAYQEPINATQMGNTFQIDTLDGRLTHAVSAIDPSRGGDVNIWTTHAVMGGAGAEQRWYEINASTAGLSQPQGVVTSATAFNYNGALAPDRAVHDGSTAYGGSMAMGLTTSGPLANPTDIQVSKSLNDPQTAPITIVTSPNGYDDFSCSESAANTRTACRWGDYAGATSDPTPMVPAGSQVGNVWFTNEWNVGIPTNPLCSIDACWETQNWSANIPQPSTVAVVLPESPLVPLLVAAAGGVVAVAGMRRRGRRGIGV